MSSLRTRIVIPAVAGLMIMSVVAFLSFHAAVSSTSLASIAHRSAGEIDFDGLWQLATGTVDWAPVSESVIRDTALWPRPQFVVAGSEGPLGMPITLAALPTIWAPSVGDDGKARSSSDWFSEFLEQDWERLRRVVEMTSRLEPCASATGVLHALVQIQSSQSYPHAGFEDVVATHHADASEPPVVTSEASYELVVASDTTLLIRADTVFGAQAALRAVIKLAAGKATAIRSTAMRTPAALRGEGDAPGPSSCALFARSPLMVRDYPRFRYRGFLVDTAHHFLSTKALFSVINWMAMLGMNVLHWHLTDDQTFGFLAPSHPELAEQSRHVAGGTYSPTFAYVVVEYARQNGVLVVPEIDLPGHSRAWRYSHPELVDDLCAADDLNCKFANLNISHPKLWEVLEDVLGNVRDTFPGPAVHLGGDEVNFKAWERGDVESLVREHVDGNEGRLLPQEVHELDVPHKGLVYFENRLRSILPSKLPLRVRWEESMKPYLLDCCFRPNGTVIEFWRSHAHVLREGRSLHDAVRKGFHAIVASEQFWYFDPVPDFQRTWEERYEFEPLTVLPYKQETYPLPPEYQPMVLGVEAACWGRCLVNEESFRKNSFTNLAVVAERMWSAPGGTALNAKPRLLNLLHAARSILEIPNLADDVS